MAEVVVEREVQCTADPASLWCHISDTERLNRAIGLGKIALAPNDDQTAARYVVSTVSGGFAMEYEERPYEWVEHERFKVRRVLRKGLFRSIENTFELAPGQRGGTALKVRVAIDPKLGMLAPVVRLQVSRFIGRIIREIERIDQELGAGKSSTFSIGSSPVARDAFERAARALVERAGEERREVAGRLIDLVERAPDPDVDRMRPHELAQAWGLPRRVVLTTCLDAVLAGLLDLCWDLLCPSCRTASERLSSLSELSGKGHCQLCDLRFESDLDRSVEATFRPSRAVRTVDGGPYCIGGPARVPHVAIQAILPPRGSLELQGPARAGKYRVFVRGGASAELEVAPGAPETAALSVGANAVSPARFSLAPRGAIALSHEVDAERHLKIERSDWHSAAATAHELSMIPEFRRMFTSETLKPGVSLRVSRVALLFTDLTNSTAMYRELGDAKAFRIVQEHFDLLADAIARGGGSQVKTIGDAVMAAFPDDRAALEAALAMHRSFADFRARFEGARDVQLKIGVHAGACYAVTANGVLDYFGQSVNVAARLQSAAAPGELVTDAALADRAEQSGWLGDLAVSERFEAKLKGLPPLAAARIAVDVLGPAQLSA
jgi:class 3 adenylate cyclase